MLQPILREINPFVMQIKNILEQLGPNSPPEIKIHLKAVPVDKSKSTFLIYFFSFFSAQYIICLHIKNNLYFFLLFVKILLLLIILCLLLMM
jgi:hypothetical protein